MLTPRACGPLDLFQIVLSFNSLADLLGCIRVRSHYIDVRNIAKFAKQCFKVTCNGDSSEMSLKKLARLERQSRESARRGNAFHTSL
jgi:hypothetical protein